MFDGLLYLPLEKGMYIENIVSVHSSFPYRFSIPSSIPHYLWNHWLEFDETYMDSLCCHCAPPILFFEWLLGFPVAKHGVFLLDQGEPYYDINWKKVVKIQKKLSMILKKEKNDIILILKNNWIILSRNCKDCIICINTGCESV